MKLNEKIWLWGQDPGTHHRTRNNMYNLPGENRMSPREGCGFFGIKRCCRVRLLGEPRPPFHVEMEKLKDLDEVVWSADSVSGGQKDADDLDEVLAIAGTHANISGAVLDDFFSLPGNATGAGAARHSPGSMREMRGRLHNFKKRRLDLWIVWYSHQLDSDIGEYLELADVVTFWTWKGTDLERMDENLARAVEKTPDKVHLAGCYMWNYGEGKPLAMEQMKYQLARCYDWVKTGTAGGIILCSNCIADIGLDTVEYTRDWIREAGEEEV